jgi:hypothetical protein
VAEALDFFLDDGASAEVTELRARLARAGLPAAVAPPAVRFAMAAAIPARVRGELTADLRRLVLPELWLAVLGTVLTEDQALVLQAVTDTELLAAHGGAHDALAGRVRQPVARYLPGSWLPHCPLTPRLDGAELPAAFAALGAVRPIRAKVVAIGLTDTRTGEVTPLF